MHVKLHALLTHVAVSWAPAGHALPHVLQLPGSDVVSTQLVPQRVGAFAGQFEEHEYAFPDPLQCGVPLPHITPHAPQLVAVLMGVSQP